MDSSSFRNVVAEGPNAPLLDAIDSGDEHSVVLPLLETELHRSAVRLQRLKEHRNALASPMYRLQPELLSNIFFTYAQSSEELFDLKWTRLLLVCRRWHNVARDTRSLWSFIDVNTAPSHHVTHGVHPLAERYDAQEVRRIETQLSRAGLWPLTIQMRAFGPPSETKRAYTTMFWNPSTLSSLNVSGGHSSVDGIVGSMTNHPHTSLKRLTLNSSSPSPSPNDTIVPRDQVSLDSLLTGNAPRLQHLSLSGLRLNMTSLHELRTLRITYLLDVPDCFALRNILVALNRCPQLEILNVSLPVYSQTLDVDDIAAVSMPHLKALLVQSTPSMCVSLFQALRDVPGSAKTLALAVDRDPPSMDLPSKVSALTSFIGQLASSETAPTIRSVIITQPGNRPTRRGLFGDEIPLSRVGVVGQQYPLRFQFTEHYSWLLSHEDEEASCIGLETEVPENIQTEKLEEVLHSWPLSQVTHLDLRIARVSASYLNVLLANLPAMTTVIVRPDSPMVQVLLVALRAKLRDHGRRVIANIIFDALGMNRRARRDAWASVTYPAPEVSARRNLMQTFSYCAEAARAGVPLDAVEILNEPPGPDYTVVNSAGEIDWSELYRDLQDGFVHEGVLHSSRQDLDGARRDLFAVA